MGVEVRRMKDSAIVAVFLVASFPALVGLTIPTRSLQTYSKRMLAPDYAKNVHVTSQQLYKYLTFYPSTVIVRLEAGANRFIASQAPRDFNSLHMYRAKAYRNLTTV